MAIQHQPPAADAFSVALLPVVERLGILPNFQDKWHAKWWLQTELWPAIEVADDISPQALVAVERLLALAATHDPWVLWCNAAYRLLISPIGSRGVVAATCNEPELEAITDGLVDAIRQVMARRAG